MNPFVFILPAACVVVPLYIFWYFFLADSDFYVALAERYGRPVKELSGKVVWITGASSGLGEAIAYELARVGAKLVLSARSKHLLEEVRDRCLDYSCGKLNNEDILVLPFDVGKCDVHKTQVNDVLNHFGQIDVLINNAGRYQISRLIHTEMEVDRDLFDVNFFGGISLTKLVVRHFLNKGGGQIVVVSSVAGKFGVPASASYVATKHALQGYYDTLRMEHHKDNISVTVVCPGIFESSIFGRTLGAKSGELFQKDYGHYECNQMTSARCAHLTLVATVNRIFEAWIAYQPFLIMMWGSQYFPDTYKHIMMSVIYTEKRISALKDGMWPSDLPTWKPLIR